MIPQSPAAHPSSFERSKDWLCLALLVAIIVPFRAWLVYNTEVPARDSVGFVRYALHLEQFSWGEVLRRHHQHPGYPAAVWLASLPVRAIMGTTPESMQVSAQLASSAAAVLLLFPMYLLGRRLFNRTVGFWSALWFQLLPVCAHHLSDGISESVFLLFVAWSLYHAVKGLDSFAPGRFGLAGMFGGLAYLTRPEGALVVVASLIVLAGTQLWSRRQAFGTWLFGSGALTTTALLVGGLYFGFTGQFTNKPSVNKTMGRDIDDTAAPGPIQAQVPVGGLQANLFAAFIKPADSVVTRYLRSMGALLTELLHLFHYVGAVAALAGLWWFGPALRAIPGAWVLVVYALLQAFILVALSMTAFYVSDRHAMVLVFCVIAPATAALIECPRRLLSWIQAARPQAAVSSPRWSLAVLLLVMIFCLPKSLQRIHGNRVGNHAAGIWLAKNMAQGDHIVDDHAWSHYFAGLVFIEGKEPWLPRGHQPTCYVVMTRSKDEEVARMRNQTEEEIRAAQGRLVYHWPEHRPSEQARVVVYAQPRDFNKHPWNVAP